MEIRFNKTGAERKALVGAICEITSEPMNYLGAPTFAYTIGGFAIDRNGTLTGEVNPDILDALALRGFVGEEFITDDIIEVAETSADLPLRDSLLDSPDIVSIEFPKDGFTDATVANLRKLVDSKAALVKKAFGANELPIEETEETLIFPWVKTDDALVAETMDAYIQFITALCNMVKEAKRVTAKEKPVENEKYAFRCFLLRLGFIGEESKTARKVLLRNLAGNGSFKSGQRKSETEIDASETEESADAAHSADIDLAEALADAELIHAVNTSFGEGGNE